MKYDTAEIRSIAGQVRLCASSVSNLSSQEVQPLRGRIPGEFEGEAADALMARLEVFQSNVSKLSTGLEGVYRELMQFARRLDLADEKSKKAIQN